MESRPVIDVSKLPPYAFGVQAPVWWGNMLMIVVETTTVALLVVSYFYVWQNFEQWPPPQVNRQPILKDPVPDLTIATINTVLLLFSVPLMLWVDKAAKQFREGSVKVGLTIACIIGLVATVLRVLEFLGLHFSWNDNAYASMTWSILGLHLIYLLFGWLETVAIAAWTFMHGLDEKHAVDVELTVDYWNWMALIWVPLYAVVYWSPRML